MALWVADQRTSRLSVEPSPHAREETLQAHHPCTPATCPVLLCTHHITQPTLHSQCVDNEAGNVVVRAEWGPKPRADYSRGLVPCPGPFFVRKSQMQVLKCLELPEVGSRWSWTMNVTQRLHGFLHVKLAPHHSPTLVRGLGTCCSPVTLWEPGMP